METSEKNNWKEVSEIELIYKTSTKPSDRPQVSSSESAYNILLSAWNPNKIEFIEQFKVLLLNNSNRVLGIFEVSTGGINGTVVDLRLIYAAALKANASAIIMAHNHPSGTLKPSNADLETTKNTVAAGKIMNIPVLDHLIITKENFYSFADNGVL